jgi:hypothetical protein
MAHFAEINQDDQVLRVVVIGDSDCINGEGQESEDVGISFCKSLFGDYTEWRKTSYNSNFRKNYAAVGYYYDQEKDAFISPKPFDSWKLNESTCMWEPPVPIPPQEEGKFISYVWSEEAQQWINLELPIEPKGG